MASHNNRSKDHFRIGQINLARSEVATKELRIIAKDLRLDVVLLQEHYSDAPPGTMSTGKDSKAAIYLPRHDVGCLFLQQLSTTHCAVAHLPTWDIYLVSGYFQYSQDIEVHLHQLERVLDALQGKKVLIGVDSNAHSPMWFSETRHYIGRGYEINRKRHLMEALILGRDLALHNVAGQPWTFCTVNGESNIDLTLSTRGVRVTNWQVNVGVSSSDHRLITCTVEDIQRASSSAPVEPTVVPTRFREHGVIWSKFRMGIHESMGGLDVGQPAEKLSSQFQDIIVRVAHKTLGVAGVSRDKGYEWWTPELNDMRRSYSHCRRRLQSAKGKDERVLGPARVAMCKARHEYRSAMKNAELQHFRKLADAGNVDPWGRAYREVSGRLRPPSNIVNGVQYANQFAGNLTEAVSNLMVALCPDDDASRDTPYHRSVRLAAAIAPSTTDALPPSKGQIGLIIKHLPNTAPGLDGITSRMVRHVWRAAGSELTFVLGKCVSEGVFPTVWKNGRLLVLPKGNGKPLTDPKAYRPITLLPVLGKVLERVMLNCAPGIISRISPAQHGFTKGRSTSTALLSIADAVRSCEHKYMQAIFLDISGAFDNAWWPMILLKAKACACPANIHGMLTGFFAGRRVGMFAGDHVVWKTCTMGCPQGSVSGPPLWNMLLDDLLRLPFPEGTSTVAYADDVTILIRANSRAGIEANAAAVLQLAREWGVRNRLDFSHAKSLTMTVKGRLQRPPTIRLGGNTVKSVKSATVLGVVLDSSLSFAQHAESIGQRAANCFGKVARISATSWGVRYRALKVLYLGTFVATVTYAADVWFHRAGLHVVKSALLRTQRAALVMLTKAYRTTSTAALPVIGGVLPADLAVIRAGKLAEARANSTKDELLVKQRAIEAEIIAKWQTRWESDDKGRETYRFFPDVAIRLAATWVEPDYVTSQLLGGHGCFRKRLRDLGLSETSECSCGETEEDMHHALWSCPLYAEPRERMLSGITREDNAEGPIYYMDLVASEESYRRFREFAHAWHNLRKTEETINL